VISITGRTGKHYKLVLTGPLHCTILSTGSTQHWFWKSGH